jgi:hypothetical protein
VIMNLQTNFKLEKVYLDCIDDLGNCFIVYWAKVEFSLARFVYSGLIFCAKEGFTVERSSFKKIPKPLINTNINHNHKDFKIDISFKGIDDPINLSLFKDIDNNELIWNCHHPKGYAEIMYNGNNYKGYGYAETLVSLIKPWNLPIGELRWGRYLSDSDTLIWINWKGIYPVNKIFFNNIEYNDAVFEDYKIIFGNGTYYLKFSDMQIIREGMISKLFSKMVHLKIFFNPRILNTLEIKFKAKTTLIKNSLHLSDGWSLFEIVTWGKSK